MFSSDFINFYLPWGLFTLVMIIYIIDSLRQDKKFKQLEQTNKILDTAKGLETDNRRLQELDKRKSEFVSIASHELRTPMAAIKSYLWMVLDGRGGTLTEKQHYYLERAYNSVDRLIKLVNDMLNISRIESGRLAIDLASVQMELLVKEVIEEITPRAQELGVTVMMQPSSSLPPVVADADKIKEVLLNLLSNALKFTPRDGSIVISFSQQNGYVQTIVRDTGAGINPADIPLLFQKFGLIAGPYADSKTKSGTGLGLYICKSIVELHEGMIWAQSEGKGKGSQFSFSLRAYTESDMKRMQEKLSQNSQNKLGIIHTQL